MTVCQVGYYRRETNFASLDFCHNFIDLLRKWKQTHAPNFLQTLRRTTCIYLSLCVSQNCKKRVLASLRVSVCQRVRQHEQLGSRSTNFHEIWYLSIFQKVSRKFKFHSNLTRITATLHEDRCIFMITSRSFLLTMSDISDKHCGENEDTLYMQSLFHENHNVYEMM